MLWRSGEGWGKRFLESPTPEIWWESGHQWGGRASLREGELSLAGDTQKVRGVLGAMSREAWSWARESGLSPKAKGNGRFLCWEGWATRGCVGESLLAGDSSLPYCRAWARAFAAVVREQGCQSFKQQPEPSQLRGKSTLKILLF